MTRFSQMLAASWRKMVERGMFVRGTLSWEADTMRDTDNLLCLNGPCHGESQPVTASCTYIFVGELGSYKYVMAQESDGSKFYRFWAFVPHPTVNA